MIPERVEQLARKGVAVRQGCLCGLCRWAEGQEPLGTLRGRSAARMEVKRKRWPHKRWDVLHDVGSLAPEAFEPPTT